MTRDRLRTGLEGERLAARYLESLGYRILSRRYRTRWGEIDLVALDGPALVFVEVKTRRGRLFGPPSASVGRHKQSRIARAASHYMTRAGRAGVCRFDVVGILWISPDEPRIEHIQDAFRL